MFSLVSIVVLVMVEWRIEWLQSRRDCRDLTLFPPMPHVAVAKLSVWCVVWTAIPETCRGSSIYLSLPWYATEVKVRSFFPSAVKIRFLMPNNNTLLHPLVNSGDRRDAEVDTRSRILGRSNENRARDIFSRNRKKSVKFWRWAIAC